MALLTSDFALLTSSVSSPLSRQASLGVEAHLVLADISAILEDLEEILDRRDDHVCRPGHEG